MQLTITMYPYLRRAVFACHYCDHRLTGEKDLRTEQLVLPVLGSTTSRYVRSTTTSQSYTMKAAEITNLIDCEPTTATKQSRRLIFIVINSLI